MLQIILDKCGVKAHTENKIKQCQNNTGNLNYPNPSDIRIKILGYLYHHIQIYEYMNQLYQKGYIGTIAR